MKIKYAVLESSGGWGGTERIHHVRRVFNTEEAAYAYVREKIKLDRVQGRMGGGDLWDGDVEEVEVDE